MTDPQQWLAAATVDDAVFALRPDYRVLLLTADGLQGGPSDEVSEQVLAAEATARERLDGRKPRSCRTSPRDQRRLRPPSRGRTAWSSGWS